MARHKMIDLPRHGTKDAARTEAERLATETQTLTVYFRYGYTWYVTSANDPMFQKYAGIKCITIVEPEPMNEELTHYMATVAAKNHLNKGRI